MKAICISKSQRLYLQKIEGFSPFLQKKYSGFAVIKKGVIKNQKDSFAIVPHWINNILLKFNFSAKSTTK